MDLQLTNKRAIVLGGTRGIGRAVADCLAGEGAHVAVCARNADQVSETVAALKATGVNAFGGAVDIADGAQLRDWIDRTGRAMGGIDILVSNAGAMAIGANVEDWEKNFRTDVLGAVNAFQSAKPFLEQAADANGDAACIFVSSVSAAETDNSSSYGPIKAALVHLAKGLARQYAAKRIRTNVVSPGTVYFEGGVWQTVEQNNPDYFRQALARNPSGRMATPQEVATAVVFLASPVSAFTTGVNLLVDGAISRRVNF
jgi:3-oxoacyl-[acyl-carrier protein] reductase